VEYALLHEAVASNPDDTVEHRIRLVGIQYYDRASSALERLSVTTRRWILSLSLNYDQRYNFLSVLMVLAVSLSSRSLFDGLRNMERWTTIPDF
jgi:hypothetical protein